MCPSRPSPANAPVDPASELQEQPSQDTNGEMEDVTEEFLELLSRKIPMGRVGKVNEVASLLLFLASDESSFCTGSEFVIDGGFTAGG